MLSLSGRYAEEQDQGGGRELSRSLSNLFLVYVQCAALQNMLMSPGLGVYQRHMPRSKNNGGLACQAAASGFWRSVLALVYKVSRQHVLWQG